MTLVVGNLNRVLIRMNVIDSIQRSKDESTLGAGRPPVRPIRKGLKEIRPGPI